MTTNKAELRRRMRGVREAVSDAEEESRRILGRLLAEPRFHAELESPQPSVWFVYVSTGNEVGTHRLIQALLHQGQPVAVPYTDSESTMMARLIDSFDELKPGRFGILAPEAESPEVEPDLCVVPCIAVTESGDRLGRGGGYYDRYLADHPDTTAIALAFDEQIVGAIEAEPHDQRVDYIVTPTRTIRCA